MLRKGLNVVVVRSRWPLVFSGTTIAGCRPTERQVETPVWHRGDFVAGGDLRLALPHVSLRGCYDYSVDAV